MNGKKIPTGRLGRLARLARVGARSGASLLVSADGAPAAATAARVLGDMRGLAAKVGQMASYVDGVVPEKHRDAYETALAALRAQAPRSSPEKIRRVVEGELGAPVDELFAEWDDEPFASASIGQVHRAVLDDGREVAVKVQHPGIERAIEDDLKNAGILERIAAAAGPKGMSTKRIFDEIASRFREELDYELEARHQRWFAEVHERDDQIRIPPVIDDRSSRRVLTSEMAKGDSLETVAKGDEALRRHYAEVLWRFVFRGNLVGGRFNADPHPGNYLFSPDGAVTFLDFGCVQPIPEPSRRAARDVHAAACHRDSGAFERYAIELLGTRGGVYEKFALGYVRRCFEPLFGSPFHMTRQYVASLVETTSDMKAVLWSKDGSFVPMPEGMALMNRLQFGFYSVLARLDVEVDYATTELAFLHEPSVSADRPTTP